MPRDFHLLHQKEMLPCKIKYAQRSRSLLSEYQAYTVFWSISAPLISGESILEEWEWDSPTSFFGKRVPFLIPSTTGLAEEMGLVTGKTAANHTVTRCHAAYPRGWGSWEGTNARTDPMPIPGNIQHPLSCSSCEYLSHGIFKLESI
jgi:hypothetical protein